MQLKFQRSQRAGGILSSTVVFCLDVRADYSPAEAANIAKYKLGGQVVYNSQTARKHLEQAGSQLDRTQSGGTGERAIGLARGVAALALATMSLNVSIASLGRGHHIECKDLPELLDAEQTLMEACRGLKSFLDAAATFNGSIILVDFDDGEKVHVSQGTLELGALPAPPPSAAWREVEPPEPERSPEKIPREQPSPPGDGLSPTDLAQLQSAGMDDVAVVLTKKIGEFRAAYPEAFWLFVISACAFVLILLAAVLS